MTTEERDQLKRDDLRAVLLHYLHDRPSVAQSADTIARILRSRGMDCAMEEVRDACLYWEGAGAFERHYVHGGGTPHFRITTQGVHAYERSIV